MTTTKTNIAERKGIEKNDLVAVEYLVTPLFGGQTATVYGQFHFIREGYVWILKEPGYVKVREERVRSIRKVTAAHVASQFYVGQRAAINKYGGTYVGKVTYVGRTRVTVEFTTRGGKVKTATLPAWQVEA